MNKEEAGEIILEGKPFESCITCGGEGRWLIETTTSLREGRPDIETETYQLCMRCESTGQVVKNRYIIACSVLSKSLPIPPNKRHRFTKTSRPSPSRPTTLQFPKIPIF